MNITWLGQSGYLLESGEQRLVVDPFFSNIVESEEGMKRLMPPPRSIASLSPDALFITHNHLDHFDPETVLEIMNRFPACRLIGPQSVTKLAETNGIAADRLTTLSPGETYGLGNLSLTATPARHSDPLAVGLLVQNCTELLWFSGDTLYYSELSQQVVQLASRHPDIAFVCINGKLGNMTLLEAAKLSSEIQPRLAIPMHYGMFAENTADPEEFRRASASLGQRAAILQCGRSVDSSGLLADQPRAASQTSFA